MCDDPVIKPWGGDNQKSLVVADACLPPGYDWLLGYGWPLGCCLPLGWHWEYARLCWGLANLQENKTLRNEAMKQ